MVSTYEQTEDDRQAHLDYWQDVAHRALVALRVRQEYGLPVPPPNALQAVLGPPANTIGTDCAALPRELASEQEYSREQVVL
jgi:hypothetical protein